MINKRRFLIDSLDKNFVLIVLFLLGVPNSFLIVNGASIHPYTIYYHCGFITLGATLGFFELISFIKIKMNYEPDLKYTKGIVIGFFLFFSITRSIIKVTGLSLIELVYGGILPSYF